MNNKLTIGAEAINLEVDNGKAFATSLDISKAFGKRHADIIRKIERLVSFEYFCNQRKIAFVKYTDPKGEKRKMYQLDRDIFLMITLTLRGEKAEKYRLDFIKAFDLLEQEYFKTQKTLISNSDEKIVLEHTIPTDPKNTISKVNGLKRNKLVKSYYRSKKGKELKELDDAIANIKKSLFGYDDDILVELIDRRNELTMMRNEFMELIS